MFRIALQCLTALYVSLIEPLPRSGNTDMFLNTVQARLSVVLRFTKEMRKHLGHLAANRGNCLRICWNYRIDILFNYPLEKLGIVADNIQDTGFICIILTSRTLCFSFFNILNFPVVLLGKIFFRPAENILKLFFSKCCRDPCSLGSIIFGFSKCVYGTVFENDTISRTDHICKLLSREPSSGQRGYTGVLELEHLVIYFYVHARLPYTMQNPL